MARGTGRGGRKEGGSKPKIKEEARTLKTLAGRGKRNAGKMNVDKEKIIGKRGRRIQADSSMQPPESSQYELEVDASQNLFETPAKLSEEDKDHLNGGEEKSYETMQNLNDMDLDSNAGGSTICEPNGSMQYLQPSPEAQMRNTDGTELRRLQQEFEEAEAEIDQINKNSAEEDDSETDYDNDDRNSPPSPSMRTNIFVESEDRIMDYELNEEYEVPTSEPVPSCSRTVDQELPSENDKTLDDEDEDTSSQAHADKTMELATVVNTNTKQIRKKVCKKTKKGQDNSEEAPKSPEALAHKEKMKKLAKLVDTHMKEMRENLELKKPTGQHKFVDYESVLPKFSDKLIVILHKGDKKEIASEYLNIAKAIHEDMCMKPGSGNMKYYSKLRYELLDSYRWLDNALLRNNYRRALNSKVPIEELSEDDDEVEELRPKPGKSRRTLTEDDALFPLTKYVSKMNREERKKKGKLEVIVKATETVEVKGIQKLGKDRWLRAQMPVQLHDDIDEWQLKIKRVHNDKKAGVDFNEGYRKTFGLRTNSIKRAKARLHDLLETYPLLKFVAFLRIEAEGFLGSKDNVAKFFSNVNHTWKGIANMNTDKNPEENFQESLSALGPLIVLFTDDKNKRPQDKHKWPYIIHTKLQTRLLYQNRDFLGVSSLKEALGYLILLFNMFDLPTTGRPQLVLLLESLFFGYTAGSLKSSSTILMNKIATLAQEIE